MGQLGFVICNGYDKLGIVVHCWHIDKCTHILFCPKNIDIIFLSEYFGGGNYASTGTVKMSNAHPYREI